MNISKSVLTTLLLVVMGQLSACGQKGDLYLPGTAKGDADDRFLLTRPLADKQMADKQMADKQMADKQTTDNMADVISKQADDNHHQLSTDPTNLHLLQDNPIQAY